VDTKQSVIGLGMAGLLVMGGTVQAAPKPPANLEQMWAIIQQQQKEIEALKHKAEQAEVQKQELEALKAQAKAAQQQPAQAAGATAAAKSDEQRKTDILANEVEKLKTALVLPESKEYKSEYGLGPAASGVYRVNRGLSVGGYGEAVYTNRTSDKGKTSDQADAQRLVMYLGYKFSDNIILNNEIEFEHATTGEGAEEKGEVSVEFSQLDFLLHPAANVRAGLLLMPMGFINEMHEPTTFHGNYRPEVERRILPSTWREIGAGLFGEPLPGLQYRVYAVNGLNADGFSSAGWRDGRQSGSKAKAEDFAVTGRVDYSPQFVTGLTVGGSAYMGNSGQNAKLAGLKKDLFTQLYEGHLQWQYRGFEFRSLGAWGHLDNADALSAVKGETIGSSTFGWYNEAAYDIMPHLMPTSSQYLAPFVRYERFDTIADVPTGFADDPRQNKEIYQAGLTYKPIRNIAIKADYRNITARQGTPADEFNLGLGFIF
jgi:hypothetical protein